MGNDMGLFYILVLHIISTSERIYLEKEPICAICLDSFDDIPPGSRLNIPCNHQFHQKCLVSWQRRNPRCPICREVSARNTESLFLIRYPFLWHVLTCTPLTILLYLFIWHLTTNFRRHILNKLVPYFTKSFLRWIMQVTLKYMYL